MGIPEIVLIVACAAVVAGVFIAWLIRKKQGKCGGDCGGDCAHCRMCVRAAEEARRKAEAEKHASESKTPTDNGSEHKSD